MRILYGKKTVLYPFFPPKDMEYFWEIYGNGSRDNLGELASLDGREAVDRYIVNALSTGMFEIWVGYTKEGKASKRVGIIFTMLMKDHIISIHGAVDKKFLKGLDKKIKEKDKVTYTEDAFRVVLNYCLDTLAIPRVETTINENNKLAIALAVKCGMEKEGVLRKYIKTDDHFQDMVMLSKIKE